MSGGSQSQGEKTGNTGGGGITWDPEADRRIKRSPFLMRRYIRKRIEDRVRSRGRDHVTEADVDESAGMYRQYRFK